MSAATIALRASLVFIDRYPEGSKSGEGLDDDLFGRSVPRSGCSGSANSIEVPVRLETARVTRVVGPRRHFVASNLTEGLKPCPSLCHRMLHAQLAKHVWSPSRDAVRAHGAGAADLRLHLPAGALRLPAGDLPGRPHLSLRGPRALQGVGAAAGCARTVSCTLSPGRVRACSFTSRRTTGTRPQTPAGLLDLATSTSCAVADRAAARALPAARPVRHRLHRRCAPGACRLGRRRGESRRPHARGWIIVRAVKTPYELAVPARSQPPGRARPPAPPPARSAPAARSLKSSSRSSRRAGCASRSCPTTPSSR